MDQKLPIGLETLCRLLIWVFEYQPIALEILIQPSRYKRTKKQFTSRHKSSLTLDPGSYLYYISVLITFVGKMICIKGIPGVYLAWAGRMIQQEMQAIQVTWQGINHWTILYNPSPRTDTICLQFIFLYAPKYYGPKRWRGEIFIVPQVVVAGSS